MSCRSLIPLAVAATAILLTGCGSETPPASLETYEDVRGRVLSPADSGRALIVEHEAIPDVMGPMAMTLRLRDPAAARSLSPGDKIRFDMVLGDDLYLENLEPLPSGTSLMLSDTTQADTTGADTVATDTTGA